MNHLYYFIHLKKLLPLEFFSLNFSNISLYKLINQHAQCALAHECTLTHMQTHTHTNMLTNKILQNVGLINVCDFKKLQLLMIR